MLSVVPNCPVNLAIKCIVTVDQTTLKILCRDTITFKTKQNLQDAELKHNIFSLLASTTISHLSRLPH